jgi:hypothetical protein
MLSYTLFYTTSDSVTLCVETYPFDIFISELASRGYSQRCINYYLRKGMSIKG